MEKQIFQYRLTQCVKNLLGFTKTMTTNAYVNKFGFILEPNVPEMSDHLTEFENNKLLELLKLKKRVLTANEVCLTLCVNGKVPLWINIEVYSSTRNTTIIKLICSRRFRNESELNTKANEFPPFHPVVSHPPGLIDGNKFDINWRENKLKNKLKSLFGK